MAHPIPDEALDADIAILGKKGRGKTYTAKSIVERLLTLGRRVVILDPLSTWWGLRSSADGASAGFPVAVFGGPHGDMQLSDKIGRQLARVLAGSNLPAVIDMGDMTKAAQNRLVGDFLDELRAANTAPLTIVLEEADMFAPQTPMGDDSTRVLGAVDWIARRGRVRGFRLISITQRPAKLHKDVLTQLSVLVALGLSSPQDRDAIKAWVEGNADRAKAKEVTDTLAKLAVGEGWVWAPDFELLERVKFPAIATLDTSSTPKAGAERVKAQTLADVDLSAIRLALAEVVDEAAPARRLAVDESALKEAEQRGYERGFTDGESAFRQRIQDGGEELAAGFQKAAADMARKWRTVFGAAAEPIERPEQAPEKATPPKAVPARPGQSAGRMNSAAAKMLAVLDTNPPVARSWRQVATLAGLKARGGHFNAGKKALVDAGLAVEENGLVRIAKPSAGAPASAIDSAALLEMWAKNLSGAAPKILLFLANMPSTRADVAAALGLAPRGGHWNAAWKELRDNGLIEEAGATVQLSAVFRCEALGERGEK